MLGEVVSVLRRYGELDIDEDTAKLLADMSAATIDRRLAPERRKYLTRGTLTYQAGHAAQEPDPSADVGRLGRRGTGFRRDRPGQP